jgi:outer membrane protein assembly factor BamB
MLMRLKPAHAGWLMLAAYMSQAHAASVVTVGPAVPHPSQTITVIGSGFGASEAVDVYLDTTDVLLLVTTATGTFTSTLAVPASAQPGRHYATAIGRHSGDAAQFAYTVSTPWTEFGYGHAHYSQNPYENTLNTGNAGKLGLLWGTAVGAVIGGPVVIGGKVFAAGNGISALSTTTGAVLWSVDTTDSFYGTPAVSNAVVYVASILTDNLYAVAASNGAKKWTTVLGSTSRSSPVVSGGIVYIGCDDYKVYAVNANTGAIVWTYTTKNEVASTPAVVDGIVYVGSRDDTLYALNATTGALIWSYATGGQIFSSPAVANGVVYVGSYDDKLYAIQAGTTGGGLKWSATTSSFIYGSPAIAGNQVIIGSEDHDVYAYNLRTGALQWSVDTGNMVDGTAAIANGVAYIGNDAGDLLAIDTSYGGIIGSITAPPYVLATAAVSDGVVYFNGEYTKTYAYALNSGLDQIRRTTHAPAISSLHPDMSLAVTH